MIFDVLLYIFAGMMAGTIAGLLGIGGGMVVVPALALIFSYHNDLPPDMVMHVAAGSSLAVMMFTAQASVRAHYRYGTVLLSVYYKMCVGIGLGTVLGAIFADMLPTHVLKILFGIFLLFVATRMLPKKEIKPEFSMPKPIITHLVSFLVGMKSGVLGIGGGAVIIPFLTRCHVPIRKIAGIASLCSMTIAVIGSVTFMITGWNEPGLPLGSTGYVYWPAVLAVAIPSMLCAPLGAKLAYRVPIMLIRRAFIVFLLVTAIHLLW